ncbi:MAG: hypothetical protein JWO38_3940 [Gemmataceae bacterium]|nr:hypothetical protein [Gemmataceae bacterium]
MSVAPVVRRVIVCAKVEVDRAEPGYPYTLRRVLNTIRHSTGQEFPFTYPELWVFAQYVDGAGSHQILLDLVRVDVADETVIRQYRMPPVHMIAGRFFVLSRGYKISDVPFPEPGVYEFRVRCGVNIGVDEIRLERNP